MDADSVRLDERGAYLPTLDRQWVYGYLKIVTRPTTISSGSLDLVDVFTDGEPDSDMKASVLG